MLLGTGAAQCRPFGLLQTPLFLCSYVNTVLPAENESDLQNSVSVFNSVCKRRKLKVNVNKSKVMVCEWSRSDVVEFVCLYRVGIECEKECKIFLNGEEM